jgi:predicted transcriptional regulator
MSEAEFQEELIKIMEERGLDDEAAARLADVSRPTIQRWKAGITAPYKTMREVMLKLIRA